MKVNKFFLLYLPFALTVFLGAFLLFQVQPMIGKYILPWFGGSSFVWITSLLFFQTILLLGYSYSYLLTKLNVRLQIFLHAGVLLISACVLIMLFFHLPAPIMPPITWKLPESFAPLVQVLGVLSLSIGLPFFVLSTTSTLLQKWFSYLWQEKSPYGLYSLSNLGSLLGLVSYPFLIEPFLPLRLQGLFWTIFFLFYLCSFSFICWQTFRFILKSKLSSHTKPLASSVRSFTRKDFLLWLFLPTVSSLLLSSVSYQLTQSVAPIPFLWLVPLSLYLISFVLCFTEKNFYFRKFYSQVLLLIAFTMGIYLIRQNSLLLFLDLLLYSLFLFFSFMVCHGELYRLRPAVKDLNLYYLVIAFGSALGSAIVAIIAPIFFKILLWEFYIALYIVALLAVFVSLSYKDSVLVSFLQRFLKTRKRMLIVCICLITIIFSFIFSNNYTLSKFPGSHVKRSFYGRLLVSIKERGSEKLGCLLNGKIIHGCQYLSSVRSRDAITYYGSNTGFALSINNIRKLKQEQNQKGIRVGVLGLGVGAIAAYGEKGDFFRFYEINPDDIEIAHEYFSYLKDSRAQISIGEGDGRLVLEKDLQNASFGKYDLLVLDAFSDDGIPVHLLTKEAFAIYLRSLSNDGIIVAHISSSYLDINPVIKQAAKHFDLETVFLRSYPIDGDYMLSDWVLLSRKKSVLPSAQIEKTKITPIDKIPNVWLWTDDYSNLLQIVRFWSL